VTKTVSADSAEPGDTLTYTIDVNTNVTNQDLIYTITDTIPDGMTYVGGSATGSPTVNGNELEWTVNMDSPALAEGFYEISTPSTNANCDTGFGGYIDLEVATSGGVLAQTAVTGDSALFTTFTTANPVHFYGDMYGSGVSFSDDGFIMFDTSGYAGSEPYYTQDIPDPTTPNGLLTMLWQDFEFVYEASGPYGQSGVSLATAGPDIRLIEWDNVRFPSAAWGWGAGPDDPILDMEIVIYSEPDPDRPEIVVAFDGVDSANIQAIYDNIQNFSFGVENNDGSAGNGYLHGDPAALLAEEQICFDWSGPVFPPAQFTYDVTVDSDAPDGVATNSAVHITDNPNDMEATATADVDIDNPDVVVPPTPSEHATGLVDMSQGIWHLYDVNGAEV
jgi:uncharacterized repeat protein (TIGR01451 family)